MLETSGSKILLGAHVSIAGGCVRSIDRAEEIGATVAQIFVKNNAQWQGKALAPDDVEAFRKAYEDSEVGSIVAHASYLINLASSDKEIWAKSIRAMIDELLRCRLLGLGYLVVHPGAHRGTGEACGIRKIAAALDQIIEGAGPHVGIALETTAGQGTSLGHRFEHLRDIIGLCRYPDQLSVCIDSCHIFAAGYDFRSKKSYRETFQACSQHIGIDRISVIHLNDSKRELGSRVDRHEHIGKGEIGLSGFTHLMADPRLFRVPMILETPKEKGIAADRRNLRVLRELRLGALRGLKS